MHASRLQSETARRPAHRVWNDSLHVAVAVATWVCITGWGRFDHEVEAGSPVQTDASAGNEQAGSKVRILFFCPSDLQPPRDYQKGLDRMAAYTDQLILGGIRRWDMEPGVESLFNWTEGHVDVLAVQGRERADQCQKAAIHRSAILQAIKKYELGPRGDLWWVFVYLGDPPKRFGQFRGGYSEQFGGWSVANYDSRFPQLELESSPAGGLQNEMAIKGTIHELGHAFGLPHIGPRNHAKRGNTLMGSVNARYHALTKTRDPRVYLSQASAAMLAAHPVVRGRPQKSPPLAKPVIEAFDLVENDRRGDRFVIRGRMKANREPVFVIIGDHPGDLPGEYWARHYVGRVDKRGGFEVTIDEPGHEDGELKVWFVFRDGTMTGDGKSRNARGAVRKRYQFDRSGWALQH